MERKKGQERGAWFLHQRFRDLAREILANLSERMALFVKPWRMLRSYEVFL
jgi:hypothetical protein